MNTGRKILVGAVAVLSLLAVGGSASANAAPAEGTVNASRWCC